MKEKKEKFKIWEMIIATVLGYFITHVLDWLLFIARREIKFSNGGIYIERPGGVGELLLYYLILTILLVLLYYLFSRIYNKAKMKSKRIWAVCLGILVIICTIFIFLSYSMPMAKVDNITTISGRLLHPDSSYSYLYVRPFGSAQCWLQNPVPLQPDTDGKWRTLAHFGGITGMGYEIVVINSGTKLDKFTHPGGYDCNNIPSDVKRFVRVVYHR